MLNKADRKELEQTLLASMLQDEELFIKGQTLHLSPESFKEIHAKVIYSKMTNFYKEAYELPDISKLYEYIFLKHQVKDEGLKTYYNSLISMGGMGKERILYVLQDDNAEIELREILGGIQKGNDLGIDLLLNTQEKISNLAHKYLNSVCRDRENHEIAEVVIQDIIKTKQGERSEYIKTGFDSIDRKIIGIHKKSISIIAARPGMGKSAFMLQLKRNFIKQGYKVGLISIEMDAESLMIRDLADVTGIDSLDIESGNLTDEQLETVKDNIDKVWRQPYKVDDSPHHTIESIKTRINSWKLLNKADVILIDYLTLIKVENRKDSRNDLAIGMLTAELRKFAKQHSIPIIIISQMNRKAESRADNKPILSDLRESGNIEQDARLVMFLYRPDQYGVNPFTNGNNFYTRDGSQLDKEEYCEVIIAKARNGRVGISPLRYIQRLHRFENVRSDKIHSTMPEEKDYPF